MLQRDLARQFSEKGGGTSGLEGEAAGSGLLFASGMRLLIQPKLYQTVVLCKSQPERL
jgi:hypothetical protein